MKLFDALKYGFFQTRNELFVKYKRDSVKHQTRSMIDKLDHKYNGKPIVGVELGVDHGHHAYMMLNRLNIKKLYCIDPYNEYDIYMRSHSRKLGSYESAERFLSEYSDKVVFIKKLSSYAIDDIEEHVDFVYIDGNHRYSYVRSDIELYFPICDIIGGHDFKASALGVSYAVLEFAEKNGLLHNLDGFDNDWWIEK